MKSIISVVILSVFCSLVAHGQELTISGSVMDDLTNKPLPGAHVLLLSDWTVGTTTDLNGHFELTGKIAPTDSILVSFTGFEDNLVAVSSYSIEIRLTQKLTKLNDVVVQEAPLISEEFAYVKIDKMDIYKNPSSKADPILAVNSMPSATTIDESANISFRGSNPEQTGIFLNNVRLYDAVRFSQLNGIGTLSIFNTDIIKKVDVFPGNPPLEFGNTTSGLISIETENSLAVEKQTSVLVSLANTGVTLRRKLNENTALNFYSNYQFSGPLKALNTESLKDIERFESIDAGLHLFSKLGKGIQLKAFNYTLIEGYDFNFRSPSHTGTFEQRKKSNFTILNLEKTTGGQSIKIDALFRPHKAEYRFGNTDLDINGHDVYVSGQIHKELEKIGWKLGANYDYRQNSAIGQVPEYYYALDSNHPVIPVDGTTNRKLVEGFGYFKYIPNQQLVFGASLRKNIPLDGQADFLSWQLNTNYEFKSGHNLKLAAGEFNQLSLGQNDQSVEHLESYQISMSYRYTELNYNLGFDIFQKNNRFGSFDEKLHGLEVLGEWSPDPKIDLGLSFTTLNVDRQLEGDKINSPYDIPFFVRGSIQYETNTGYTISFRTLIREGVWLPTAVSSIYHPELIAYEPIFTNPEMTGRLSGYQTIDLSVSKIIAFGNELGAVVFAGIENIFNKKNVRSYEYSFDYSQSEDLLFSLRTVYFGMLLSF